MGEPEAQPLAAVSRGGADKQARRRRIKWCGCISLSLLLIIIVIIIILIFTVFKVKDPKITMNQVKVTNLDLKLDAVPRIQVRVNMTLAVAMTIKNPNAVTFRFDNTTTTMDYHGTTVAEAYGPPGEAKARRTFPMNITVDFMADRLLSSSELYSDITGGEMNMTSFSIVPGRVNIWNIVKKHVVINLNCSLTIDVRGESVKEMICKRKVKL
ncbi:hypothetical protein QN277_023776 [Acacia crassicarpa]|uniref:Late embryogenesis abundant protein LEA-2 subgroup domain-containing protein n=1 Tax=Acacia crassicarpa TaxID=499986 RepID=A0AAE1MMD3_9FABA|nr:hypothetical protein QN277_023776 [Acacia crassicarpa]